MIMTTLGSDYFPHTAPGRVLCFLLAVFAFSIFGYITAAVSSYFINKDASDERSPVASDEKLERVLREVVALRAELQKLQRAPGSVGGQ
jgi:voltage-gated potassium channel